jgi:hypothetical protein
MTSGSDVRPERARWPRLAAPAHAELRSLLPSGYAGYTEATAPRHLVMPATTAVPLVMKLQDSAYRPPQFLMGAHGSYSVLEGDCAPSYVEVRLAPLGAYTLLGLPPDELSGLIVDLTDVLGPAGRRLAERVRDAATWPASGQRPPPGWCGSTRSGGDSTGTGRWTGASSPPTSATPTRPTSSATSASSPGSPRPSSWPSSGNPSGPRSCSTSRAALLPLTDDVDDGCREPC